MTKIVMYWNNICVLHRRELSHLAHCKEVLARQDIDLQVTCFGLGYPRHMSDYLRDPDPILPDIIVSADLEVFKDRRIFRHMETDLLPIRQWYDTKSDEGVPTVDRGEKLLPYLIIPLVFYSHDTSCDVSASLEQVAAEGREIAFGGINNSAAKSVVKTVWSRYGRDMASTLFRRAVVTGMPVQSFQLAKTDAVPLALVPSLFAVNTTEGIAFCPNDGAVAVPSYICVRNSIGRETASKVLDLLFEPAFLRFFVEQGNLISALKGSPPQPWMERRGSKLQITTPKWLDETHPQDFYRFYCEHIPAADRHD